MVKLPEAKRGFVLLPRRWVVERSFGWAARFRRLARAYEKLPQTLAGLHYVAFVRTQFALFAFLFSALCLQGELPYLAPYAPTLQPCSHFSGMLLVFFSEAHLLCKHQ